LTRDQGAALRARVLEALEISACIVLDLSRVEALSPSFADELFGGLETALASGFHERIRISCPSAEWKRLISSALAHRRGEPGNHGIGGSARRSAQGPGRS